MTLEDCYVHQAAVECDKTRIVLIALAKELLPASYNPDDWKRPSDEEEVTARTHFFFQFFFF